MTTMTIINPTTAAVTAPNYVKFSTDLYREVLLTSAGLAASEEVGEPIAPAGGVAPRPSAGVGFEVVD